MPVTLDRFVTHPRKFGTECVLETASAQLNEQGRR
jgi:hypothetical protein